MTRTRSLLSLALLASLASPAAAQERTGAVEEVTSDLRSEDWAAATDVVIVAEGYRVADRALFEEDARRLARRVRVEQAAKPMREGRDFNFHFAFVSSKDRGTPWQPGRDARDTPFTAHVDPAGEWVVDTAEADLVAARLAPDVDCVVVLVKLLPANDGTTTPRERIAARRLRDAAPEGTDLPASPDDVRPWADWPTDGSRLVISSIDTEAFIHELGHALYGLGDEYSDFDAEVPAKDRKDVAAAPNLTLEPSNARWRHLLDAAPVEGGGYYARGVWRPERSCRMRESRERLFCAVCEATIAGATAARPPKPAAWSEVPRRVDLEDGRLRLAATWRHQSPTPAHRPVSFGLELRRVEEGGRVRRVWTDAAEPHRRTATLDVRLRTPGTYRLGVTATNLAGDAETAWTVLEVRGAGSPGAEEAEGLVDRLRD